MTREEEGERTRVHPVCISKEPIPRYRERNFGKATYSFAKVATFIQSQISAPRSISLLGAGPDAALGKWALGLALDGLRFPLLDLALERPLLHPCPRALVPLVQLPPALVQSWVVWRRSGFGLRSLFSPRPFHAKLVLDNRTGVLHVDYARKTPTFISRLRSLWKHIRRARSAFEAAPDRGLLSKAATRPLNVLWNFAVKGVAGTAILLLALPITYAAFIAGSPFPLPPFPLPPPREGDWIRLRVAGRHVPPLGPPGRPWQAPLLPPHLR